MQDLEKFNQLADTFKKKILEQNSKTEITPEIISKDKLNELYILATDKIKSINKKYIELLNNKTFIGDAFIQALCYLVYFEKIKNNIDEYYLLTQMVQLLFAKNSKLNTLLEKLEKYLVIYKSENSTQEQKEDAQVQIDLILKELYSFLMGIFTNMKMIDQDAEISVDEDGKVEIKSKAYRNVNTRNIPDNTFLAYSGFLDRSGYIAQKSYVYVKRPIINDSYQKYLYITAPGAKLANVLFQNNPKNIIFGIFNIHDYVGEYLAENDGGEEEDEKKDEKDGPGAYVIENRAVRFGNILSPKDITEDSKQSITIKFSKWNSIRGSIEKRGAYTISDFSVEAKFKNKDSTSSNDLDTKYTLFGDNPLFSDSVKITQTITSAETSAQYMMQGTLDYDEALTNEKNEEILNLNNALIQDHNKNSKYMTEERLKKFGNQKTGTFYKGTLKFKTSDGKDLSESGGMTAKMSSKDVICKIEYNSDNSINISCKINDENNSNLTYIDENQDSDLAFLPSFLTNFDYDNLPIENTLISDNPEDEIMKNLLGLTTLDIDDAKFDFKYSQLMNAFLEAKNKIMSILLVKIRQIADLVSAVTTISGLMPQFDDTFNKEYIDDLIMAFSHISTDLMPFTSGNNFNTEDLYNGTIYSKLVNGVDIISQSFQDLFNDIILSDELTYKCDNILKIYNNSSVISRSSLKGVISTVSDMLSLNSQSISILKSSGHEFIKMQLRPFNEWNSYFNLMEDDNNKKIRYFMDDYTKSILYITTQIMPWLNPLTKEFKLITKYIKIILFRLLMDNINNPAYNNVFDETVFSVAKAYKELHGQYTIDINDINSDHINPYIYQIYPKLKEFDTYDLNNMIPDDLKYICKSLIYISILETNNSDIINRNFKLLFNFLNNGQKLNFREIIFMETLLTVYKEIKSNKNIIGINSLDLSNVDYQIRRYRSIFNSLLNFYNIMNNNKGCLSLLNNTKLSTDYNIIIEDFVYVDRETLLPKEDDLHQDKRKTTYKITLYDLLSDNIVKSKVITHTISF